MEQSANEYPMSISGGLFLVIIVQRLSAVQNEQETTLPNGAPPFLMHSLSQAFETSLEVVHDTFNDF